MANAKYRPRGDTAANWTAANPVLAVRELGLETDTRKIKIGDGTTAWNALGYVAAAASISGSFTVSGYTMNTARMLGRLTAGVGAPEELTAAAVKGFLAITASDLTGLGYFATGTDAANLTGTVNAARLPAISGDITIAAGAGTATVTKLNGVALSGLGTGILKNTTGTGVPSIAVAADFPTLNQNTTGSAATLTTTRNIAMTGDVAWNVNFNGSAAVTAAGTIQAGAVTLAKMANLAANSILGNNTGSAATPIALTFTQVTAALNAVVGDAGSGGTKGLVPAPAAGDAAAGKFLKADGTWAVPAGGGGGTTTNALTFNNGGAGVASGGTFNGSAAVTISYNSIGATRAGAVTSGDLTMTTARILGRTTAATGAIEELTAANVNTFLGLGYFATGTDASNLTGTINAARFPAMTGDVTAAAGSNATTIAANVVTNAKAAQMPTMTIKGNNTGGTANAVDLTTAQVATMLGLVATATSTDAANLSGTLANARLTTDQRTRSVQFVIDGGGAAITTGVKGFIEVPFAGTIQKVTVLADQAGSIVVDIWKDTYANYPPTVADTITASAKPTLSAASKAQDATLTGWNKTIAAGDILGINVDSATTVQRVTIAITVLV